MNLAVLHNMTISAFGCLDLSHFKSIVLDGWFSINIFAIIISSVLYSPFHFFLCFRLSTFHESMFISFVAL